MKLKLTLTFWQWSANNHSGYLVRIIFSLVFYVMKQSVVTLNHTLHSYQIADLISLLILILLIYSFRMSFFMYLTLVRVFRTSCYRI